MRNVLYRTCKTLVASPTAATVLTPLPRDICRRMDQQVGALSGVRQALMPAFVEAPPRRRGCSRHKARPSLAWPPSGRVPST